MEVYASYMGEEREPRQKTRPKGKDAKPIEIPVPKRGAFDKLVKKAARPERRTKER